MPSAIEAEYIASGYWTDESLGQLIATGLKNRPSLGCKIRSQIRPWSGTYAQLADMAFTVAAGLRRRGVGRGDVIACQLPNWVEAAVTFYAGSFLGAVVVPIVHFYGVKEVRFILEQSRARVLVTADSFGNHDYLPPLEALAPALSCLKDVFVVNSGGKPPPFQPFDALLAETKLDEPARMDPSSPALVSYTSGTTADPKGVIHSQRTINFEVRQ